MVRGVIRLIRLLRYASFVLPPILLAAWGIVSWRDARADIELENSRTTALLQEHVLRIIQIQERLIDHIEDLTRNLSWDEVAQSRELHDKLRALDSAGGNAGMLALVDPTGRMRNSNRAFPVDLDSSEQTYYRGALENMPNLFVGERFRTRISGTDVFTVSRIRKSQLSENDGVIVAAVRMDAITPILEELKRSEQSAATIVRADGASLAHYPVPEKASFSPQSGIMKAISASTSGSFESVSETDGLPRLFAYSKVDDLPIFVAFGTARAAMIRDWVDSMGIAAGIATAFMASGFAFTRRMEMRSQSALVQTTALAAAMAERATELRAALDHKQELIRELHHRVKNNLQIIASLLRLHKQGGAAPEDVLESALGRIRAMALVHNHAYADDEDAHVDLILLIEALIEGHSELELSGPRNNSTTSPSQATMLRLDRAVPLALIVNEIITVALRRSPEQTDRNQIVATFVNGDNEVLLRLVGNVPMRQSDDRFGEKLVTAMCQQMDAQCRFENGEFLLAFRPDHERS